MMKTAIVTGGTRGIGYGIAAALGREGWRLVLCGRRPEEDVRDALRALQTEVVYVQANIGSAEGRARLVARAVERFGAINVLVNNAGIGPRVRVDMLEASEENFEEVLRVNVQGPYFLTQAVARQMVAQKQQRKEEASCIVNITSISATVASVNRGEYCVAKAGLSMASRLWAVRLAEYGIAVYEVRPGIIATDMTAGVKEKYDKLIANGLLLEPRWGTPEDIGKIVAALARGDMPYATGQVIVADGGLTITRL